MVSLSIDTNADATLTAESQQTVGFSVSSLPDGSVTEAKLADGAVAPIKLSSEFADKYIQNNDAAASIMGNAALSYIQFSDLDNDTSSMFFYDTSGRYTNWGDLPTTTVDGKHGITCSPFVMDLLYGVVYSSSAYIDGTNKLNASMLRDKELISYFTQQGGSTRLAKYAVENGYAFYPSDDLSNLRPGDVIFTGTGAEEDAYMGVGHSEVVGYWTNDSKFLVWHAGSMPRTNIRISADYADSVLLCARFPFSNTRSDLVNLVKYGEADKVHTVNNTWVIADYHLSESIKPYTYYTAIFKMTSTNDIADQYPTIRDRVNDLALSATTSGATQKPANDIYCVPFYSTLTIDEIRLGMTRASSSVSYDTVTVEWMSVVEGIVTEACEFIPSDYVERYNDSSLLMTEDNTTSITPTTGSSYSSWGGCYYYKIGTRVHVHVGISGLSANTNTQIYTLPSGFRPTHNVIAVGQGASTSDNAKLTATSSGALKVWSANTYALVNLEFDAFEA